MSNIVFETSLSESEKAIIKERARSGCLLSQNGHLVVDGIEKNQYSKVRVFLRGKSYLVNRSRLCYFVDNDFQQLSPEYQLSHLCHIKDCCRREHLAMEPASINNSRKQCERVKKCQRHDGFQDCQFE